jgi:hypothetical protein
VNLLLEGVAVEGKTSEFVGLVAWSADGLKVRNSVEALVPFLVGNNDTGFSVDLPGEEFGDGIVVDTFVGIAVDNVVIILVGTEVTGATIGLKVSPTTVGFSVESWMGVFVGVGIVLLVGDRVGIPVRTIVVRTVGFELGWSVWGKFVGVLVVRIVAEVSVGNSVVTNCGVGSPVANIPERRN